MVYYKSGNIEASLYRRRNPANYIEQKSKDIDKISLKWNNDIELKLDEIEYHLYKTTKKTEYILNFGFIKVMFYKDKDIYDNVYIFKCVIGGNNHTYYFDSVKEAIIFAKYTICV